jgi:hypothetical protein
MNKAYLVILCILVFARSGESFVRYATSDIPLASKYFYRLAERRMAMSPSVYFTDNFAPFSGRESEFLFKNDKEYRKLFGNDSVPDGISEAASKYYNPRELSGRGFDFIPRSVMFKGRLLSDNEKVQSVSDFGDEAEEDLYGRLSFGGTFYAGKYLMADFSVAVVNDGEDTEAELENVKLKIADRHSAYIFAKDNVILGPGRFGQLIIGNNISPQKFVMIKTEIPYNLGPLGMFRYYLFNFWFDDNDRRNKDPQLVGMRFSLKPADWIEITATRTSFYGGSEAPEYGFTDFLELLTAQSENVDSKWNTDQFADMDLSLYLPFLKRTGFLKGGKLYTEYNWTDLTAPWQEEDKGKAFSLHGTSFLYGLFLTTGKTDIRFEYTLIGNETYVHPLHNPEGYTVENYLIGHQQGRDSIGYHLEIYTELTDMIHPYLKVSQIERGVKYKTQLQKEQQYTVGTEVFMGKHIEGEAFFRWIHQDKEDLDSSTVNYDFSGGSVNNTVAGVTVKYLF